MKQSMHFDRAERDLLNYGRDVYTSEIFTSAFGQTHHYYTTVGDHTLNVALTSLKMAYALEKLRIRSSRRRLVIGSLCHDLGIIGRADKFKNNRVCCHQHPIDSLAIAKRLVPGLDDRTENIIIRHMWPLTLLPPTNRESVIVDLADTYSTFMEIAGHRPKPEANFNYHLRERLKAYILKGSEDHVH